MFARACAASVSRSFRPATVASASPCSAYGSGFSPSHAATFARVVSASNCASTSGSSPIASSAWSASSRARTASAACLERGGRRPRELGRAGAVELEVDRARLREVVRADLEQLLAGPLGEPRSEGLVQLRAHRLREHPVGDLADQHVLEPKGALA